MTNSTTPSALSSCCKAPVTIVDIHPFGKGEHGQLYLCETCYKPCNISEGASEPAPILPYSAHGRILPIDKAIVGAASGASEKPSVEEVLKKVGASVDDFNKWMREPEQYRQMICDRANFLIQTCEKMYQENKRMREALEELADPTPTANRYKKAQKALSQVSQYPPLP